MSSSFLVLAPNSERPRFGNIQRDTARWNSVLRDAGRVRADAYLADGAIRESDVAADGSFRVPLDGSSWHVQTVDSDGGVTATVRLSTVPLCIAKRRGRLPHVDESLARAGASGERMQLATERYLSEIQLRLGHSRPDFYVVGGWAADARQNAAGSGAELAMAIWALTRMTSSAGAIATATERHDAYGQLVRMGARPIHAPGQPRMFFDPIYGCKIGLLGFTVFQESPRIRRIVDRSLDKLKQCEVITCLN